MYRIEVTSQPDGTMKAQSKDAAFTIDTKGRGITPPDTLLASLAGCVGVYVRKYAGGAKLVLDDFVITAEAEFTKEPPLMFKEISVTVDLKGVLLDERRKQALVAFIENCPVHHTLQATPAVHLYLT